MARFAARQYGIVTRRQLTDLGYTSQMINQALRLGRLQAWHRDVFAVGHGGLSAHGLCQAAVLFRGPGTMISFQSAVWLWGLERKLEAPVSLSVRARRVAEGEIGIHHRPDLRDEDFAATERLPVTSVPRTLLDYASIAATYRLEGAIDRADRLDLLDPIAIDRIVDEVGDHHGAARLARAMRNYRQSGYGRAGGEEQMLVALAEAGVREPAVKGSVAGYQLDFYWERERFAVELDSWEEERAERTSAEDRRRREQLAVAGVETIRITGTRLKHEPEEVAIRVAEHLDRRRPEDGG
jgi:very-short-patch-repair endonuclease